MAELKVLAEWRGGGLLREIERKQGERTDLTSSDNQTRLAVALSEIGGFNFARPRTTAHGKAPPARD